MMRDKLKQLTAKESIEKMMGDKVSTNIYNLLEF